MRIRVLGWANQMEEPVVTEAGEPSWWNSPSWGHGWSEWHCNDNRRHQIAYWGSSDAEPAVVADGTQAATDPLPGEAENRSAAETPVNADSAVAQDG